MTKTPGHTTKPSFTCMHLAILFYMSSTELRPPAVCTYSIWAALNYVHLQSVLTLYEQHWITSTCSLYSLYMSSTELRPPAVCTYSIWAALNYVHLQSVQDIAQVIATVCIKSLVWLANKTSNTMGFSYVSTQRWTVDGHRQQVNRA